jgi:hypothetical protein
MQSIEHNPKLGFYTVGDKTFYSKPMALMEATQTGHFPHWNFNRDTFSKINTCVEPATDLRILYKLRAQQLRDRYDYIRLEFSGGSDSTTVLLSFINNKIHLDEIVFRYPAQGDRNLEADAKNTKAENTLSEWEFAAKPMLQKIAVEHPEIKITLHDFSDNILKYKSDESWIERSKDYLHPEHTFKHDPMGLVDHQKLADTGKQICVLYGIDKPKLCIKDGRWWLYFMDMHANHAPTYLGPYTNINTEYFYWQPDLPEIIIKQAHTIRNWFMTPHAKHLQFLLRWPNHSMSQRQAYEQLAKPLIYPDYDPQTWQAAKSTNAFYSEMAWWFFKNFKDSQFYNVWEAGIAHVVSKIDPKFFNYELGKPVGFVGFMDQFYDLGPTDYLNTDIMQELLK